MCVCFLPTKKIAERCLTFWSPDLRDASSQSLEPEPGDQSLEPRAWSQSLEPRVWSLEPGTLCLESGVWSQSLEPELGARAWMEPRAWGQSLESRAWRLEPGAWSSLESGEALFGVSRQCHVFVGCFEGVRPI